MSSDQKKENNSSEENINKIKQEETEDPTEYYAQGDSKEIYNEESEFRKPVPPIEMATEEMNLLRVVSYLGFGLAALAIVFILFFIRDLDHRVGGVDSALNTLEDKIAPLRKEVKESIEQVNTNINGLKIKIEDRENRAAVIELKRALAVIQTMGLSDSPKIEAKSNEVVTSIQALLGEFSITDIGSDSSSTPTSAGEVIIEEATEVIELPVVKKLTEDHPSPVVEEHQTEEHQTEEQQTEEHQTEEHQTEEHQTEVSSQVDIQQEETPHQTEDAIESIEEDENSNEESDEDEESDGDEDEDEEDDE